MGDSAQEIAAHFFLLCLRAELFLLLDLGGQRTDHDGDGQHDEERQGVAGNGKVQLHIGICKNPVYPDDADHGGQQTEQISVCKARDEHDRAFEDQRDIHVGRVDHPQQRAQQRRCCQYAEAHSAVAPGKGKYLPQAAPEGLVFRISRHIHRSSPSI